MNIGDLFFSLRADDDRLKADINKSGAAAGTSFGASFKQSFSKQNISKGIVAGLGVGGGLAVFSAIDSAISSTIGFLGDSATAAREEGVAVASLTAALEANVAGFDGNVDAIEETIAAREELGFSDDEQRESLARLVAVTGDENVALDLQRQAMDLARLRGIDLADASQLIGKVFGGNVGILSRYGFQLEKGTSATEALAIIQGKAAGQAEAFAETEQGAADAAAIAFDNLQEELGSLLLPVLKELALFGRDVVIPFLRGIIKGIKDWAKENKPLLDTIGKVADILGKVLFPAIGLVVDAISFVAAPFLAAINLIVDFLGAIIDGGPKVGKAVSGIVGFITSIPGRIAGIVGKVIGFFAEIGRRIGGFIRDGAAKVVEFILSIPGKILGLIGKVGKVATDAAAALLAPFVTVVDTIRDIIGSIGGPQYTPQQHRDYRLTGQLPAKPTFGGKSPDERAWGGPVSRGRPYLIGERGPEMFVPSATGAVRPLDGMIDGSSGGSRQGDINVNVQGLIKARDPFEIATQIRRVREFVVVTPRDDQ